MLEAVAAYLAVVVYPDAMDEHDWAVAEAKGWIEVTVRWAGGEKAIVALMARRDFVDLC